jgi:hypothetical protein
MSDAPKARNLAIAEVQPPGRMPGNPRDKIGRVVSKASKLIGRSMQFAWNVDRKAHFDWKA